MTIKDGGKLAKLLNVLKKAGKIGLDIGILLRDSVVPIGKALYDFAKKHPQALGYLGAAIAGGFTSDAFNKFQASRGIKTGQVQEYLDYLGETNEVIGGESDYHDQIDKLVEEVLKAMNSKGRNSQGNHPAWWNPGKIKVTVDNLNRKDPSTAVQMMATRTYLVDIGGPWANTDLWPETVREGLKDVFSAYYSRLSLETPSNDALNNLLNEFGFVLSNSITAYADLVVLKRYYDAANLEVGGDQEYGIALLGMPFLDDGADEAYSLTMEAGGTSLASPGAKYAFGPEVAAGDITGSAMPVRSTGDAQKRTPGFGLSIGNKEWADRVALATDSIRISQSMREYADYLFSGVFIFDDTSGFSTANAFYPPASTILPPVNHARYSSNRVYWDDLATRISNIKTTIQENKALAPVMKLLGFDTIGRSVDFTRDLHGKTIKLIRDDDEMKLAVVNAVMRTWVPTFVQGSSTYTALSAYSTPKELADMTVIIPSAAKIQFDTYGDVISTDELDAGEIQKYLKFFIVTGNEFDGKVSTTVENTTPLLTEGPVYIYSERAGYMCPKFGEVRYSTNGVNYSAAGAPGADFPINNFMRNAYWMSLYGTDFDTDAVTYFDLRDSETPGMLSIKPTAVERETRTECVKYKCYDLLAVSQAQWMNIAFGVTSLSDVATKLNNLTIYYGLTS